jgi:hypothetical protein
LVGSRHGSDRAANGGFASLLENSCHSGTDPITDTQEADYSAGMKSIFCALATGILAACGMQTVGDDAATDNFVSEATAAEPEGQSTPEMQSAAWTACESLVTDKVQNKWWGGFTACQDNVRVDVEADSADLGGPAVRITVLTPSCSVGAGAANDYLPSAIFKRPYEEQIAELKRIVKRSLNRIPRSCGGPVTSVALFRPELDQSFFELAERYWLHLQIQTGDRNPSGRQS